MKAMGELVNIFAPQLSDDEWAKRDAEVAQKRAEVSALESAEQEREKRQRYEDAGFTRRALDAALRADESTAALTRVKAWDAKSECVLVLSGPAGCGKTVAATWWAWHKAQWPRFLRSTSFAASSRYDHEQRNQWLGSAALVLDDLGTEYADAKGNFQVDLDELIDTFYGDRKPLIITTNCTQADFKGRYGTRVIDRIRECGTWFSIKSESLRRKP